MPESIQYVDIGTTLPDGSFHLRARCVMRDGIVTIEGRDAGLIRDLEQGIYDEQGELRKKTDGLLFLDALSVEFKTPYFYATSIKEGEPPLEDWK